MIQKRHLEVRDATRLKKRVEYFLSTDVIGRREVRHFAHEAGNIGQVHIVGGMLRDLYLAGNRGFNSDVDFVIGSCSASEFSQFMIRRGGIPNRFGGFRLKLDRWSVEMWRLEDTWAHQQGYCSVSSIEDVANATFFDWDAIFYDVARRRLIVEDDYFTRIRNRILELRLADNPNVMGNVVRALRYVARWNALLGPRLARLILRELSSRYWEDLVSYEAASFKSRYLPNFDGSELIQQLRRYDRTGCVNDLQIRSRLYQPPLPLLSQEPGEDQKKQLCFW